ncbi:hypothetical protein QFC24_002901 [Naganishia onofrii]|uniref:Uncharacterized protein n=1 Tax=Naganishia onofrii TaxID=1851511 RepID=A0ACC2XNE6_9TREE|nr:hypothetical protein QFC24_002901 [Naganishia onofrii]
MRYVFVPASVPAPPSPAAVVNHSGPTATPTATYQPPPPPPPPHQRLRTIARLLPRFIGAAIKIEIALWMITRSLHPSSDWRYWAFVLAGVGWWVWECVGVYRAERERGRVVREREREREREVRVPQEGQEAVGRPVPPAAAVDPGNRQQQQQQQQQPAAPRRTRGNNNRNNTRPNPLPFLGLAYERRLLRLFYLPPSSSNSHPTTTTTTTPPTNPHRIPTKDTNLPLAPADPSIAWTYLFIPMYVCVLSLWPAGEAARKRAIREREGDMRALSARLGEGVAVAEAEAGAEAEVQRRASEQQREGAGQGASEDGTRSLPHDPTQQPPPLPTPTTTTPAATTDAATTTATATAPSVIPRNLSPASERYWRRILARGETIDWDEERAAQERVLGAAGRGAGGGGAGQDEDAEAGGLGMGMGLW